MPSDATNRATREEWRELGFFYDVDDSSKAWRLVGSRAGLLRFRDLLVEYVAKPRNTILGEHDHYGPYMYLKIMTWSDAGLDSNAIFGTVVDLARLASLTETKLKNVRPGVQVRIQEEFASRSEYGLVFDVREEGFDPASADPKLPSETS